MSLIQEIINLGHPWHCHFEVANAGTTGVSLIIPKDSSARTPTGGEDANRRLESTRLVLLGFQYDVACAASEGFDVYWADQSYSPAGTPPGSPAITEQYILRVRNPTAAAQRLHGGTPFCLIPGPTGYITPGIFTPWNPADLVIAESGASAVTSGTFIAWGVEAPADWRPMKKYTGSPVDLGA